VNAWNASCNIPRRKEGTYASEPTANVLELEESKQQYQQRLHDESSRNAKLWPFFDDSIWISIRIAPQERIGPLAVIR
jgi:hypothetical protein